MNRFARGVEIISKHQPDAYPEAQPDQLWFGKVEDTPEEDRKELIHLQWFEDGGYWSFFT